MFVKQLSVFLENREGRLDKVLATLKENDINIVSLSLADTSDYGLLRMIVSDPAKGKAVLKEAPIELDCTILPIKPSAKIMNTANSVASTLPKVPLNAARM